MSGKQSRYLDAGSPTSCFLPSCNQAFIERCTRGSDENYFCSQKCADKASMQELTDDAGLSKSGAQIAVVSECINHCFAFDMWCYDFARHANPEDMVMGLHVAFELVSNATRLHSFVALRKLDEFLRAQKSQRDDLIASDLGIDRDVILGGAGKTLLTPTERVSINKSAAHLTERLTLDPDTEVDLQSIVERSMPVFERISAALRKTDSKGEVRQWLDKTDALLKLAREEAERVRKELASRDVAQAKE